MGRFRQRRAAATDEQIALLMFGAVKNRLGDCFGRIHRRRERIPPERRHADEDATAEPAMEPTVAMPGPAGRRGGARRGARRRTHARAGVTAAAAMRWRRAGDPDGGARQTDETQDRQQLPHVHCDAQRPGRYSVVSLTAAPGRAVA